MTSPLDTGTLLRSFYAAKHDPHELGFAAHMLYGHSPTDWSDFIDFYVTEWVDAEGYTVIERAVDSGLAPDVALRIPREVQTALWVVDGWEHDLVLLRDLATEKEMAVLAPGRQADLPRRTVLRARVVPEIGRGPADPAFVFTGSPDLYDGLGVIGRLDLLRAWQETPEPDLHDRLSALRAAFVRQREEHTAFTTFLGASERVYPNAEALNTELSRLISFLNNEWRFGSLGGRTRSEAHRSARGSEPHIVQIQLGESLRGPGRPGIVYDRVHGAHFLPAYGELLDHFAGRASHPEVVQFYVDEPGLPAVAFRTAPPEVQALKPVGRAVPSVLPGWDE